MNPAMRLRRCLPGFFLLLFAGQIHADTTPHEADATARQTLSRYQKLQVQTAAVHGVYDVANLELLIRIGQLQQSLGQHPDAITAFSQAIQIIKVNNGLYARQQLPVVERLLDSLHVLNDEQALRRYYAYLLWVYKRHYADDNASVLPIIKRVGQWYYELYDFSPPGSDLEPLVAADSLYDEALAFTEAGLDDRVMLLYRRALVNYRLAEAVMDHTFSHREIRAAMLAHKRSSPYVHEIAVRQYFFDQSFFKARRAIEQIIALYERRLPDSAVAYAEALVFLADGHHLLRRTWNADKYYRQAYAVLLENQAGDEAIRQIFGKPVPIDPPLLPGEARQQPARTATYVDALLDVPVSGWPTNIRIVQPGPATNGSDSDDLLHARARQAIAALRYRPRYVKSEAVATSDVKLRFVFKQTTAPGRLHF